MLSQDCISSWPWENPSVQAEGCNFLSSQNGIMMGTQARRMFCASTYQRMLSPSSLYELTDIDHFSGNCSLTKCCITQSSIALSLECRCMHLTLLCLFSPPKNESLILCIPTSIYKLKDYSSKDDVKQLFSRTHMNLPKNIET